MLPMNPISIIPSTITASFKFAEYGLKLAEVSKENRVFLQLIERVRKDLEEISRERREKLPFLRLNPQKLSWIDGAIHDAEIALADIGRLVEGPRVDMQTKGGSVSLVHRFQWVLMNHQKFVTNQGLLATAHTSLMTALGYISCIYVSDGKHNASSNPDFPSPQPPAYEISVDEAWSAEEKTVMGFGTRRSRRQIDSGRLGEHIPPLLRVASDSGIECLKQDEKLDDFHSFACAPQFLRMFRFSSFGSPEDIQRTSPDAFHYDKSAGSGSSSSLTQDVLFETRHKNLDGSCGSMTPCSDVDSGRGAPASADDLRRSRLAMQERRKNLQSWF